MKLAHIIMAYKNPQQIERMIRSMAHPNFDFYIHLDKKIDLTQFEYLKTLNNVYFIKERILCNWGGYSFVKAIFSSLKEILSGTEQYNYLNLMSGQDYPIKPIDDIYNFFKENPNKCFISYEEDPSNLWWKHAVTRTEMYHFTDAQFRGRYMVQGLMNKFLPRRTFPLSIPFFGSSDSSWWAITPQCGQYMLDFVESNRSLRKFMEYTWGADEFLIATLIMNSPFKDQVVNNNLRYITWSNGIANPRVLVKEDLKSIKASEKLFARKFDSTVDETILDELDKYLAH
jgi:hypothetical protein